MQKEFNEAKNCWVIKINMDMDLYNVPQLKETMLACIDEREAGFILDCHEMSYIDSTGLGVL
ncbi:MAG: STAS domain-containing protein, partial [Desulfobacterales bacterium]|nr:STAS domain-containing protein [Desulfobacterales bacterium]